MLGHFSNSHLYLSSLYLNTYIARYARVRRTEIYCAIARKLSQANL